MLASSYLTHYAVSAQRRACPVQDARDIRQMGLLTGKVWKDYIKAGHTLDRGLQIKKGFFDHSGFTMLIE